MQIQWHHNNLKYIIKKIKNIILTSNSLVMTFWFLINLETKKINFILKPLKINKKYLFK